MPPLVVADDSEAITQCGYELVPGFVTGVKSVDQYQRGAVAAGVPNGEACIPTLERRPLHPNPPISSELCPDHDTPRSPHPAPQTSRWLCSRTSAKRFSEDEPARGIEPCRPTLVAKKRLQLLGLVEDLDDLVPASVAHAPQVQIRTMTDDVGVRDLARSRRVVAVCR